MLDGLIIRNARRDDLLDIQRLSNELGKLGRQYDQEVYDNWATSKEGEEYFIKKIAGDNGICLVAEKENKVIGFVSGTIKSSDSYRKTKTSEVDNLYIEGQYRSEGVGSSLLDRFVIWSQQQHTTKIFVNPFLANEEAVEFYKKNGFVEYSIILEKKLGDL